MSGSKNSKTQMKCKIIKIVLKQQQMQNIVNLLANLEKQ